MSGVRDAMECLLVAPYRKCRSTHLMSAPMGILLQKSKVAAALIFGENLKREDIGDSHSLSRATAVAHEFSARR